MALFSNSTQPLCVGFTRAFRMVWQSFEDALFQMVVSVRLAAGETRLPGWDSMGIRVQLLLVGLLSDRLLHVLSKLKFALAVLVTSWTEKKQRRQSAGTGTLCPLLLSVVFRSAMISAPLLPLFSLPIFLWASLGLSIVGLGPGAPPASVQTPFTTSR